MASTHFAHGFAHGKPNLVGTHRAHRLRNGSTSRQRTLWVVTLFALQAIAAFLALCGYARFAPSPGSERGDQGVSNAAYGR